MIWGSLKTLAGQFVHKKSFDFDSLQPILCDELTQLLVIQSNEAVAVLNLIADADSGVNSTPCPPDYGAVTSVTGGKGPAYDPVPIKNLLSGNVKGPHVYAISGDALYASVLGPLTMVYQKRIVPAASDADSNVILDKFSNIYLWGLLVTAGVQLEDDEMVLKYGGRYSDAVTTANARYNDQAFGPGMEAQIPGGSC